MAVGRSQASAPSQDTVRPWPEGGRGAAAAQLPAVAELLALVPKRKRSKPLPAHMERVSTMSSFAVECDCRSSVAAAAAAARSKSGQHAAGVSAVPIPLQCTYYEAGQQLYAFLDAPAVLRFNKHIRSGYRAGLSYRQCCGSMLSWHNETGNIWTHLLPLLLLVSLVVGGQLQSWQGAQLAFLSNAGSIAACFAGSVAYHTCMGHHHTHDHWLKLDVCGILLVLVGGGHMVLWWGLHCHPTARYAFAVLYYACGALCVRAALTAKTAKGRGLPMLALFVVRISSFVARAVLQPPSQALQHYMAMEVASLTGGLLNVLRIPERWLQPSDPLQPAPLDYLFNSHQLMHVLVAVAMWQLHLGATEDYHTVQGLLAGTAHCPA